MTPYPQRGNQHTRFFGLVLLVLTATGPVAGTAKAGNAQSPSPGTNLGTLIVTPPKSPFNAPHPPQVQVQKSLLKLKLTPGPGAIPTSGTQRSALGANPSQPTTPPQPLRRVAPRYPAVAYRQNVRGRVTLSFTVNRQGRPVDIRILSAQPPGLFDQAARKAVHQWRFTPAMRGGHKVTAQVTQTLVFRPPSGRKPAPTTPTLSLASHQQAPRLRTVPIHALRLVAPQYPPTAYRRGIQGTVTIEFTIEPNGHTANIHVVNAHPQRIFNLAAIRAVKQWRFAPPAKSIRVRQTIQFTPP